MVWVPRYSKRLTTRDTGSVIGIKMHLTNPEQQTILSAMDISGKPIPTWLEPVFDAENRLLNRIDFPRAYNFTTERRQWHIAGLSSEEQRRVYDEASKLPASSIEHLDIIVEEGMLV